MRTPERNPSSGLFDGNATDRPAPGYYASGSGSLIFLRPEQLFAPALRHAAAKNRNTVIRLADSIKRYGLTQTLAVRPFMEENGICRYEIVEGELYWQAACLAGVEHIACTILPTDAKKEQENAIFSQIRNKKLHIFEQAAAFRTLIEDFGLTQGEIARRLCISQSAVANKLRLLQYNAPERERILQIGLSERHARAVLRLKDAEKQRELLDLLAQNALTVAQTEALVERMLFSEGSTPKTRENGTFLQENGENGAFFAENGTFSPPKDTQAKKRTAVKPRSPDGIIPRKFALKNLQPLYNSIERTLSIFRKTGRSAEMAHEEGPEGILITISIPPEH